MNQSFLLDHLIAYRGWWAELSPLSTGDHYGWTPADEEARVERMTQFARSYQDCFERHCVPGHITGSALVVSPSLDAVLLTLHKKLGIWLQLGGHSDGDHLTHRVAMREAQEESGLEHLHFLSYEHLRPCAGQVSPGNTPLPFDLDCHLIPARKDEPAHIHYDVRYLIIGDRTASITISDESQDLRWFSLEEAQKVTQESSMLRQFAKLQWLQRELGNRQALVEALSVSR